MRYFVFHMILLYLVSMGVTTFAIYRGVAWHMNDVNSRALSDVCERHELPLPDD